MMSEIHPYHVAMILVFIFGYLAITVEKWIDINKTTSALLMAVLCWVIQFADKGVDKTANLHFLGEELANISQVVFFLFGALSIVEIINAHHGFEIISSRIEVESKRKFLWVIALITFFLSAVLDNLTTTIVMITMAKKIMSDRDDRLLIGGAIVIAANAGGAWTPIGDVTTTMLWIGGNISSYAIMVSLFLPSLVCAIVSMFCIMPMLKGNMPPRKKNHDKAQITPLGNFIFFLGVGCLLFVPVFKAFTGLPPYMGILFGLSIMWLVTDIIHRRNKEENLRVPQILSHIDMSGVLFFLGILLSVTALNTAGILEEAAAGLDAILPNPTIIATIIGIVSAIVDNVPLVAGLMGMYELSQFPMDSYFWHLVAYCAGTGGSLLIIGSAAGVVFMSLEKVDFLWYVKKITLAAALGYFAGIGMFLLQSYLFS
jgi:NhaD family Na+/H+ antiporter